jgi:hypothetical protein
MEGVGGIPMDRKVEGNTNVSVENHVTIKSVDEKFDLGIVINNVRYFLIA